MLIISYIILLNENKFSSSIIKIRKIIKILWQKEMLKNSKYVRDFNEN